MRNYLYRVTLIQSHLAHGVQYDEEMHIGILQATSTFHAEDLTRSWIASRFDQSLPVGELRSNRWHYHSLDDHESERIIKLDSLVEIAQGEYDHLAKTGAAKIFTDLPRLHCLCLVSVKEDKTMLFESVKSEMSRFDLLEYLRKQKVELFAGNRTSLRMKRKGKLTSVYLPSFKDDEIYYLGLSIPHRTAKSLVSGMFGRFYERKTGLLTIINENLT